MTKQLHIIFIIYARKKQKHVRFFRILFFLKIIFKEDNDILWIIVFVWRKRKQKRAY